MKHRSEEQWAAVIADWRQSSLSARRYASSKGIAVGTLLKWDNRLAQPPCKASKEERQSRFLEVTVDEAPAKQFFLRITTPSGCRIEVPL